MIKGGGGALLREKVLHSAARTIIITAESFKFVRSFDRSVPIEVHPFALYVLRDKLQSQEGVKPELRMLNEGYPYVTENGNFVLDTIFQSIPDVRNKEIELKNISGVIEVGLFTKHANVYYIDIIGPGISLASKIASVAKPNQVLVGESIYNIFKSSSTTVVAHEGFKRLL